MSFANYTDLQTVIASYINDSNLASKIPDWIVLAESRLNRKLRLLEMQRESYINYDPAEGSRFVNGPQRFVELIDLRIKKQADADTQYVPLIYKAPEHIFQVYENIAGQPQYYTLRHQFEFNRLPDQIYVLRLDYIQGFYLAGQTNNWLLLNHPDVYLYGALLEAMPYLKHDNRIPVWQRMFRDALQEIDDKDQRSRDDATLDVSEAAYNSQGRSRYNIIKDVY